jgi:hypothetical protein
MAHWAVHKTQSPIGVSEGRQSQVQKQKFWAEEGFKWSFIVSPFLRWCLIPCWYILDESKGVIPASVFFGEQFL